MATVAGGILRADPTQTVDVSAQPDGDDGTLGRPHALAPAGGGASRWMART